MISTFFWKAGVISSSTTLRLLNILNLSLSLDPTKHIVCDVTTINFVVLYTHLQYLCYLDLHEVCIHNEIDSHNEISKDSVNRNISYEK